jgi:hypothetical protein
LFSLLRQNIGGHNLKDDHDVETAVTRRLVTQDTDFCQRGIKKLVPRCDKSVSFGGEHVEK